jgi:predicted ATPase
MAKLKPLNTHLKNIGLKNFRVFKDKTHFEFAPITILTGTNGSGKSSLITALDTLKNYAKTANRGILPRHLIPPNSRHPFSANRYLVNKKSGDSRIIFEAKNVLPYPNIQGVFNIEFEFQGREKELLTTIRVVDDNRKKILDIDFTNYDAACTFFYRSIIDDLVKLYLLYDPAACGETGLIPKSEIVSKEEINAFKLGAKWLKFGRKQESSKIGEQNLAGKSAEEVEDIFNSVFFSLIPDQIEAKLNYDPSGNLVFKRYSPTHRYEIDSLFDCSLVDVAPFHSKTFHAINGVREKLNEAGLSKILEDGEYEIISLTKLYDTFHKFIISIWFSAIDDVVRAFLPITRYHSQPIQISPSHKLVSADSDFGKILSASVTESKIKEFINKWLSVFNLGNKINVQFIEDVYGYKVGTDKQENIADFGYGMAKLIPLMYFIAAKIELYHDPYTWYQPHNPLVLLLEEPEANLHPALQSKLADMFVDAARTFNTQFIIETHSEYLIRKLQYLTAKGKIKPEDTAIYYFYPPDDVPPGEEQVKRIDIQEDGSLTDDFGTGFFDEADKIAMSIWNMNKAQKN